MKRNIFAILTLAVIACFSFQSCQKNEPDTFADTSSARMQKYMNEVKEILTGTKSTVAGNEWIMDYYAGTSQSYGGYAYVLSFGDQNVTATYELDPEESYTSLYKFTTDNGPVISFDTYNEALHYFATPSSSKYEAMGGDFEFTILSYSDNKVELLGKRSGNVCTLRPLDSVEKPRGAGKYTPEEYVQAVANLEANYAASELEGTIGKADVVGAVSLNNHYIELEWLEAVVDEATEKIDTLDYGYEKIPFVFTPTGMKLYKPTKIAGCTVDNLTYLVENNILTNGVITLKGKVPEDYKKIDAFLGDFQLTYRDGTLKVHISQNEDGTLSMSGFNSNFDVILTYDKARGRADMAFQVVGTNGSNMVCLCPWDTSSGYLTRTEGAGLSIHWVEEDNCFHFSDNGVWEGYNIDSFILYELTSAGSFVGEYKNFGTSRYIQLSTLKPLNP